MMLVPALLVLMVAGGMAYERWRARRWVDRQIDRMFADAMPLTDGERMEIRARYFGLNR